MTPATTDIEFNVDGLPPVTVPEVEEACRELAMLTERFCGGGTRHDILTPGNPRLKLAPA